MDRRRDGVLVVATTWVVVASRPRPFMHTGPTSFRDCDRSAASARVAKSEAAGATRYQGRRGRSGANTAPRDHRRPPFMPTLMPRPSCPDERAWRDDVLEPGAGPDSIDASGHAGRPHAFAVTSPGAPHRGGWLIAANQQGGREPLGRLAAMQPPTGLPELDVARVQRWCDARVPERARYQVHLECEVEPGRLTIVERRAPFRPESGAEWTRLPVARLRYTKSRRTWSLSWRDRNLRFHTYDRIPPSPHVDELLAELDRDPTHIFWG